MKEINSRLNHSQSQRKFGRSYSTTTTATTTHFISQNQHILKKKTYKS